MKIQQKKTPLTVDHVAKIIDAKVEGPNDLEIVGLCALEDDLPGYLSLFTGKSGVSLSEKLPGLKINALVIREEVTLTEHKNHPTILRVKDPILALVKLIPNFFERSSTLDGISRNAEIDPSAVIGKGVSIGAFCSIAADVAIGDHAVIYPHVVIYSGAKIGANVTIHSGAVVRENCVVDAGCTVQNGAIIGSDGFGYAFDGQSLVPVPQVGNVVIQKNVDIGANTCVDRATLGSTRIGLGSKLDNLVQVGHNTTIGPSSILCGQTGIAGSCTIGTGVVLGGQSGVADHLTIADGTRLNAKAGVTGNITEKGDYGGYPAVPIKTWRRQMKALERLSSRSSKKNSDS